jgi:hypothetical protein
MANKAPVAPISLLPSPEVFLQAKKAGLSPETIVLLLRDDRKGKQRFALANSLMGGACFLGVVGGFIYLVMQGKETPAYVLLGPRLSP